MQSILIYGGSSSGKTTQIGLYARYQHYVTGAPVYYIGADSGWEAAADEVAMGILKPYSLSSHPNIPWALRRLTKGFWPAQIDPVTGAAVNPLDFRPMPELGIRCGGLAVEGITRINELLSGTLSNDWQLDTQEPLTAKFRIRGDGTLLQGKSLDLIEAGDEESFSMASRGTYKFVQEQTLDYVNRFKAHPFAPRLLMTAHQGEGKSNEGVSARVLGPSIFGKAGVANAPGWFSHYFHIESIPASANNNPDMKALWFVFHPDRAGSGLLWPSKLGVTPRLHNYFCQQNPWGFIPSWIDQHGLRGGIGTFLQSYDSQAWNNSATPNQQLQITQ
jgi:hypothetical protein